MMKSRHFLPRLILLFLTTAAIFWVKTSPVEAAAITIRARGTICRGGYPNMQLKINGAAVKNWTVRSEWKNYSYSYSGSVSDVAVAFTNDCYNPPQEDRNLRVDYVKIDATTYQTEAPDVFSTGTWSRPNGCNDDYKQSEWLHCTGEFRFTNLGAAAGPATAVTVGSCSCTISASPTSANEGDSIRFSSSASGFVGTKSYAWDFGDCSINPGSCKSTAANPSYSYTGINTDQTFAVNLTISDTSGSSAVCPSIDVDINAFAPISGTVWEDLNQNNQCNDDEAQNHGLDGATVTVSGPDTDTKTTAGNGRYTTKELDTDQLYTLQVSKSDYLSVDSGDYPNPRHLVLGGRSGIDFCLSKNPPAWFQVKDGDVYGRGLSIDIPQDQFFMTGIKVPDSEGTIASTNLVKTGPGSLQEGRSTPWLDGSYASSLPTYSYFHTLYATRIASGDIQENSGMTAQNGRDDNQVFFVGGDLAFNSNFNGRSVFFVQGKTVINGNVSQLKAVIISQGNVEIENSATSSVLEVEGLVVSLGGSVVVKRVLSNNTAPAVRFTYNPYYLLSFTKQVGISKTAWQEIAP